MLKIFKAPDTLNLKRNPSHFQIINYKHQLKAPGKERKKDIEKKRFKNLLGPNTWYPRFEFAQRFHLHAFSREERFLEGAWAGNKPTALPDWPGFCLGLVLGPSWQAPRKQGPPPSSLPEANGTSSPIQAQGTELARTKHVPQQWNQIIQYLQPIYPANLPSENFHDLSLRNLASQRWNPKVLLLFPAPTICQINFGRRIRELAFLDVDTSDEDHLSVGKTHVFKEGNS